MVVCRFFEQGRCSKGDTCAFEHARSKPAWPPRGPGAIRPDAPSFQPRPPAHNLVPADQSHGAAPVCSFFQQGACKYGFSCKFKHPDRPSTPIAKQPEQRSAAVCTFFLRGVCQKGSDCRFRHEGVPKPVASDVAFASPVPAAPHRPQEARMPQPASETPVVDGQGLTRTLRGATVVFDEGAAVQSVSLLSDFSTVLLSHIPSTVDADQMATFVTSLGFVGVSSSSIQMRPMPGGEEKLAEVRVNDPSFAERFLRRAGHRPVMNGTTLTATQVQLAASDAGSKRLQLNLVSCSWYRPSKVAWLHFEKMGDAHAAVKTLRKRKVRQRRLQVTYQEPPRHAWYRSHGPIIHSVQVGNLDVETTRRDLVAPLSGGEPQSVKWGPASYRASNKDADGIVKRQLESFGRISDWEVISTGSDVRAKATARFVSAEDARTAAHELDKRKVPELGDTKIYVSAIASIKLSVQASTLRAVQADMDELKARVWESDHTYIKSYDAPAHKLFTTLRIYGGDRQAVAKAKGSVEKVLAGTTATDGENHPIQNPFLFGPAGFSFLQELMKKHSIYIHRDAKKTLLRMYGPPDAVATAQTELQTRSLELSKPTHTTTLTQHSFEAALRRNVFRRLVEAFGKDAVKINVAGTAKTITFRGTADDFEAASAILASATGNESVEDQLAAAALSSRNDDVDDTLCAVCWTAPEDAVRRPSCGHAYCRDCLAGQCASSAGEESIPIRCLGGGGGPEACNEVMALKELAEALSAADFETLLETSFTAYVRARLPSVFQYCPTPDCDRVFRSSSGATTADAHAEQQQQQQQQKTVLCDECLVDVCTACHAAAHDGLSCAAAKYLAGEGEAAFQKWREEHDARPCPKCGSVIEKTYGCNHMHCSPGCGVHICWFCMHVFDSSAATYKHMGEAHGGI